MRAALRMNGVSYAHQPSILREQKAGPEFAAGPVELRIAFTLPGFGYHCHRLPFLVLDTHCPLQPLCTEAHAQVWSP